MAQKTLEEMKRNILSEDIVSMFLGLLVVVVVGVAVFNYFQRRKGTVTVPGVSEVTVEKKELTPETKLEGGMYKAVEGDSLWKIAQKRYNDGYKWVNIARENRLSNPGRILVGQELKLPELGVASADKIYTVVKGDSLWNISVRLYGDGFKWTSLWEANRSKIVNPNVIIPGTKLLW